MKVNKHALAALVATAAALFAGAASAAIDISAEVTSSKADITSAGTLIIGVVLAVVAFNWIRRVIK